MRHISALSTELTPIGLGIVLLGMLSQLPSFPLGSLRSMRGNSASWPDGFCDVYSGLWSALCEPRKRRGAALLLSAWVFYMGVFLKLANLQFDNPLHQVSKSTTLLVSGEDIVFGLYIPCGIRPLNNGLLVRVLRLASTSNPSKSS